MSDSLIVTPVSQETSSPIQALSEQDLANKEAQEPQASESQAPETAKNQVDEKFASKFAALSRKEKQVREQDAAIKAEKAEIEKLKAEIEKQKAEIESERTSWKSKLKENPFEALKEADLSYETLSEMVLNDQNPTPEMQMKRLKAELESGVSKEIQELKALLAEKEAKEEAAAKQHAQEQYDTVVAQYKESLKNVIDADNDLELIRTHRAYDLVFDVVEEYFNKTGNVLAPLDAAKHVEKELEAEAQKILKAKKFQPKTEAKPTEQNPSTNKATLTNTNASEVPVNGKKLLSREESIAEAAKRLRFTK